MKNNYNYFQKTLHKFLLSSKFLKESMFSFEQNIFIEKEIEISGNHVFISGLARSGSTILLNTIYKSKQFASLTYKDMPFILAPNFWAKLQTSSQNNFRTEREHNDGLYISPESPEAFEEVFWMTFNEYSETNQNNFKNYIKLILKRYSKIRYLSKNNQNIHRLLFLKDCVKNSIILIPFRDPLQQANSLLIQHTNFCIKQKNDPFLLDYMKLIGHREFGLSYNPNFTDRLNYLDPLLLNHWLEQWLLTYDNLLKTVSEIENIIFVCYETLCNSSLKWTKLKNKLSIDSNYKTNYCESINPINKIYNQKLNNKCYELYSTLQDISI